MTNRILAVGNRYLYPDNAALMVYDEVMKMQNMSNTEWIDGGLGGLNLVSYFENIKNILILDYMPNTKHLTLFTLESILQEINIKEYSHETALFYLLKSLSTLVETVPNITLLSCNPQEDNYIQKTVTFVKEWSSHV